MAHNPPMADATAGQPSPFRVAFALLVGYGVAVGVVLASRMIAMMVMGPPPDGPPTTPYLVVHLSSSFLGAIVAGYTCARLAPPNRRLLAIGLLILMSLAATVAAFRSEPDFAQPRGYLPLVSLLGVIGLWTGAMIERARHGTR
jgi:hypothetical protein